MSKTNLTSSVRANSRAPVAARLRFFASRWVPKLRVSLTSSANPGGTILRSALGKLIHAGHVTRRAQDSFVIGGEARASVEKLLKESTASFSVMQFFEDFLEVDPYTLNDAEYDDSQFALSDLSDADVEAAARAYHEDLQALWRELRQIDKRSLSERAAKFLEEVGRDR